MKFSELWLREWINTVIDSITLREKITMAGLEVNKVERVADHFTNVVVGKIISCKPHPNDNTLQITKVDIGDKRCLNIVCGAPNCRSGLRVAVATIGATLAGNLKIKSVKLRGEPSEGMLCSFAELGIFSSYTGIIELPDNAPINQDIHDYLKLDDYTIDINVTPNRSDCLSILGIARDVALCNRIPLVKPKIEVITPDVNDTISIRIDTPAACPRYLGRVIKHINFNASTPLWMQEKLRRCGLPLLDTIRNIVNFVLLELGQPIHVFDLDKIEGGIIVRYATSNEVLTLLDGRNIMLTPDTLVIADYKKILAMAGVFVSADSGISSRTHDIVLECAFFKPIVIARHTRRYALHTDTSYRYERGVDPRLQQIGMERATELLITICGGKPGPVVDVTSLSSLKTSNSIFLRRKMLNRLVGKFISDKDVHDILIRLGCQVGRSGTDWYVLPPSWRFDISIEEDLIEEIIRIYGYGEIPNIPIRSDLFISHPCKERMSLIRAKTLLVDRNYHEAITYSFVDPKKQVLLHPKKQALLLLNPISKDMSVMRLSLWTGLLCAVVYNQHRQQKCVRLFESGLRFVPDKEADLGVRQELILSGVITGPRFEEHWSQDNKLVDFYDIKGDLEALFEIMGKLDEIEFRAKQHPALHPGQSAGIYFQNELIGNLGAIHPEIEDKLNLNGSTLVFELLWERITGRNFLKARNVPRFPTNRRDISIVVPDKIAAADVIAECKRVLATKLVSINLFDVYRGEGIEQGLKSLAISLVLQDKTCTLEEKEIAAIVEKCLAALKKRFQVSLRN